MIVSTSLAPGRGGGGPHDGRGHVGLDAGGVGAVALEELAHPCPRVGVGAEVGERADQARRAARGRGRRRRGARPSRAARGPARPGRATRAWSASRASPSTSRSTWSSAGEEAAPHGHVGLPGEAVGEGEEVVDARGAGEHRRPGVVDEAVALDVGEHRSGPGPPRPRAAALTRAPGRSRGRRRWRRPTRTGSGRSRSSVSSVEQGGGADHLARLERVAELQRDRPPRVVELVAQVLEPLLAEAQLAPALARRRRSRSGGRPGRSRSP